MVSTRASSRTPSRTPSRKRSSKSLKDAGSPSSPKNNGAASPSPSKSTPRSASKTSAAAAASNSTSASPATPTPAPKQRRQTRAMSKETMLTKGTFPAGDPKVLAPKSEHYEFMGPPGAFFISTTVPFFSYALYYFCNEQVGCAVPPKNVSAIMSLMGQGIKDSFFDGQAWIIYFGWYAFCVLAWALLPAPEVEGTELRTGGKLKYQLNALRTLVLAFALVAALILTQGPQAFTFLYDHWVGLVTVSLVNSVVQAIYVHARSFGAGRLLAKGGNTGNLMYDWFIGRELNPRIGKFDIKYFNELRPGLILWCLLDISCACHQYVRLHGKVTDSMLLVNAFHILYVVDSLWNEAAILTTMDITTDGFGFMLSVGDLTWVPFVYSLQARYLAFHPVKLGLIASLAIFAFNGLGYYIFRVSNGEKNDFRNGNNSKKLKYMTTSSGRRLITSGWWGRSRHPNYMGDLIMGLAWSLPCGFETPLVYMYVVYFLVLLVHRQLRDDEACHEKYGKDWERYCKLVPYRIFPYIY
ncbi:hypothetical protein BDZ90DRAFT_231001 [Jaminaea rosea]|uniref:Delta(14)-sterol reductase ERG24 n=1 Tax=Jaminaea rosea TaxID=1569628 RepID=A0A316UW21_9BASI|nr:hypothetical protein BDZ90DRAFT_231001 [Jaminaea rosea]PWN28998.1 hypothetical protein BDZ90DRAFT_231001 [Jaminaea rosea]